MIRGSAELTSDVCRIGIYKKRYTHDKGQQAKKIKDEVSYKISI